MGSLWHQTKMANWSQMDNSSKSTHFTKKKKNNKWKKQTHILLFLYQLQTTLEISEFLFRNVFQQIKETGMLKWQNHPTAISNEIKDLG